MTISDPKSLLRHPVTPPISPCYRSEVLMKWGDSKQAVSLEFLLAPQWPLTPGHPVPSLHCFSLLCHARFSMAP